MFYPLKFKPVYKDYIWGGRNLEKLGKILPKGIVAESWELSCHKDGMSIIDNGEYEGLTLNDFIAKFGKDVVGHSLPHKDIEKFPLLIKFIDANDKLSVQVHPEDEYAMVHENGELGKNEMWYIIDAEPGAQLIYDVVPGTTRESFAKAVNEGKMESLLKSIVVEPGDTINIPAGLIHAIGKGIVLAEVQQNSNTTYRVYDYDRTDKNGNKRPLHIDKALDVIDFNRGEIKEKVEGLRLKLNSESYKTIKIANKYFAVEIYDMHGSFTEEADGSRFYIYTIINGEGEIYYSDSSKISIKTSETILIPAQLGKYTLNGNFKAIKSYVPDIKENIILPLKKEGYSESEIFKKVEGLNR